MKHLDKISNIMIILAVIVFLGVTAHNELQQNETPQPRQPSLSQAFASPESLVGRRISVPGHILPQNRDSLVLVVSTTCHFCKDSLPFYKKLTQRLKGRMNVVALLPQPVSEGESFLARAGVQADQVISASPVSVGTDATPTVLLLDGTGRVKRAWVGRLDRDGQVDLLNSVIPNTAS